MRQDDLMVAFDLGSSYIRVAVAKVSAQHECGFEVLDFAEKPSSGIRCGDIRDIISAVEDLQKAISEIELRGHYKLVNAYCALGGSEILGQSESFAMPIQKNEIAQEDVDRLLDVARHAQIPEGHQVLNQFVQTFWVDQRYRMSQPVGSAGQHLQLDQLIISVAQVPLENTCRCITQTGLDCEGIVVQPLASALATLTPDERDNGVVHINFGEGTTGLAIYQHNTIQHIISLQTGFGAIVQDISKVLECSHEEAAKLLETHGAAQEEPGMERQMVSLTKYTGEEVEIPMCGLVAIIQARLQEICDHLLREIKLAHLRTHIPHFVITGGGSQLKGLDAFLKHRFVAHVPHMKVRLALPRYTGPMDDFFANPRYATVLGIFYEQLRQAQSGRKPRPRNRVKNIFRRFKAWLLQFNFR